MARPSALNEDPFNAMMSTLEGQLKGLRQKFDAYRLRVDSGDTADAAFKAKTAEMREEIAQGSNACSKMRTALSNVEQHREKFPHIDDRELGSRKAYVDRLDAMAHRIRAEFHSPAVQSKLTSDERRALTRRTQAAQEAGPQTAYSQGNAAHLSGMRSEQLQVIKQQDTALDKLSGGLDTLHEMANVIDSELKDQDKILEDITVQTDAAQNKMDQAIAHIEKLIGKPGCCSGNTCQLGTIGILVIIFVIVTAIALS